MRFKIVLRRTSGAFLPINYQYELSSAIYKIIAKADEDFAQFLHTEGYREGGKVFKLFTFSHLDVRPYKIKKDHQRIELLGDEVAFIVSFLIDAAAENFIRGLFLHEKLALGDKISRVDFVVSRIESLAPPFFGSKMRYSLLSPVCVTVKKDGHKYPQYLSPEDVDFGKYLINNLISKYSAHIITTSGGLIEDHVKNDGLQFRLLTEAKKKGVTIKALTESETKVIGYTFDFELIAPVELQEIGYHSGFGEKNSMGFGCGEVDKRG